MDAVTAYADSFVAVAQNFTPSDGSLAEQYNRDTGIPLSAVDLTWSYAAFITMAERKSGQYPPSWGSRDIVAAPSTCSATSTPGVYIPATAAGAPNVTIPCSIAVRFNVNASTYFGENVYVVGSDPILGEWNTGNAFPLSAGGYSDARPLWAATAYLTAGTEVKFKYARQQNCDRPFILEDGADRVISMPACGGEAIVRDDAWAGAVGTPGNC